MHAKSSDMRLIRRPWVWFYRFRKRRGYGVHSPFAYSFLTSVVYERTAYYAYHDLNRLHPWWVRRGGLYPLTCRRLLFRLANYVHPQRICIMGDRPVERAYLTAAVPRAKWVEGDADFLFVAHEQLAGTRHDGGRGDSCGPSIEQPVAMPAKRCTHGHHFRPLHLRSPLLQPCPA